MDITQTDAEMANNDPIEVFALPDGGKSVKYKIRALPISRAEPWMEEANAVEALQAAVSEAQQGGDRKKLADARKAYNDAVYACVRKYPITPELPAEIEDIISPTQMARAFALMQMVNDPFVTAGLVQMNIQKQAMKGLPLKLIEKKLTTNGSTRDS